MTWIGLIWGLQNGSRCQSNKKLITFMLQTYLQRFYIGWMRGMPQCWYDIVSFVVSFNIIRVSMMKIFTFFDARVWVYDDISLFQYPSGLYTMAKDRHLLGLVRYCILWYYLGIYNEDFIFSILVGYGAFDGIFVSATIQVYIPYKSFHKYQYVLEWYWTK